MPGPTRHSFQLHRSEDDSDGSSIPVGKVPTTDGSSGWTYEDQALTIEEVDGTPTVAATKLVLPNGTLGVVGTVATYTPAGGGGGDAVGQFVVGFDGGGANLVADKYQDVVALFDGTITGWTLLADQAGSAVVDIWADTYANFAPTVGDSITAAAKPTLSSASKAQGSPTGWTTAVTAARIYRFHLDSVSALTKLVLVVDYSRP